MAERIATTTENPLSKSAECILQRLPPSFVMTNQHLIELLDAHKSNIWEVDLATHQAIDFGYSESLAALGGYERKGENIDNFYTRLHPEDRDAVRANIEHCRETLEDYIAEFRIQLLNGEYAWVGARGRYLCNQNGTPVKLIGIWRFINDEKKIQALLLEQQTTLSRLARSYFVGEFTSTFVHEISQPLLVISTYLTACLRRLKENTIDSKELISIFEIVETQLAVTKNIIKRIKCFIMNGELNYETVNLPALIKTSVKFTQYSSPHPTTFEFYFEDDLPEIEIDRYQIKQVMFNLILNALEAMNEMKLSEPKIIIEVKKVNDMLETKIIDNGPGISPEEIKSLFTPFFSTKEHGMGVGLPICRNIIQAHGGTLTLDRNHLGSGTVCCFTLPINRKNQNNE